MIKHKFQKETEHIKTKINVINEILQGLNSIIREDDISMVRFEF